MSNATVVDSAWAFVHGRIIDRHCVFFRYLECKISYNFYYIDFTLLFT